MRVVSLAVDGIHQACHRGLFKWFEEQDADIICLQDIQARTAEVEDQPEFSLNGYFNYVFDSADPHSNGVAIYTREAPKAVMFGFGLPSGEDMDGRYLQADFEHTSIISLMVPRGHAGEPSQEVKMRFLGGLQSQMLKITRKRRNYIFCGGWQCAATDIDLHNPEQHEQESGFLPEERQWFTQLYTDIGYADAFRLANTDPDEFSWWPSGQPSRGEGWRTDTQIVSKSLIRQVEYAALYKTQSFSSHTPVIIDYDIQTL